MGNVTLYEVFPGIELVYNDMHMEYCNKQQKPASNVMEINYCKVCGAGSVTGACTGRYPSGIPQQYLCMVGGRICGAEYSAVFFGSLLFTSDSFPDSDQYEKDSHASPSW